MQAHTSSTLSLPLQAALEEQDGATAIALADLLLSLGGAEAAVLHLDAIQSCQLALEAGEPGWACWVLLRRGSIAHAAGFWTGGMPVCPLCSL